ncbi:competence protein CoiA family protein [Cellulomonas uda]|uniref:Competence protein CoiA nuclease-like domain-containing protein n=1 Tax=Cellulomonas uda TaxID=1714 RepID=A0A4Y3KEH0_CELUD|nr:RNA methyltransferase [Cellulomonas uda]NII67841.1 competence protein CoiA [Cellulomonas uda]GEA82362.1 hypothetical protein CUD01_28060 [Cellulomonas uda]
MPLSAILEGVAIDATLEELAPGVTWEIIHRVRPRPELTCPACGAGLHAKVSPAPRRLRYFAHDALGSECPLSGESLAHRLLKVELANAIRDAGWEARLEVAGDGWRADVLATDPTTSRRAAWEAQLSPQTADETAERTENLRRSGVGVCWVTDKRAPWLGSAPSVRVARGDAALQVVHGHARLTAGWCQPRHRCEGAILSERGGPCDGHRKWSTPDPVTLSAFVGFVLTGRVRPHHVEVEPWEQIGPWVWTAPAYVHLSEELTEAERQRDEWLRRQDELRADHEQRIRALLKRQEDLRRPVMEWMLRERGKQVVIADGERAPRWAMGVPVYFGQQVIGVVCPVASRVDEVAGRLANLVVFAASNAERDRIVKATRRGLEVVVLAPTTPPPDLRQS